MFMLTYERPRLMTVPGDKAKDNFTLTIEYFACRHAKHISHLQ